MSVGLSWVVVLVAGIVGGLVAMGSAMLVLSAVEWLRKKLQKQRLRW